MSREELIREARRLRRTGLSTPQIGRLLGGIPDSTIRNWCLGGDCVDCGASVDGSNGVKAVRCASCLKALNMAARVWTPEAVVAAIRSWAEDHGRPPAASDWRPADPNGAWPNASQVYKTVSQPLAPFATWADAIAAAGFARPAVGVYERTPEMRARIGEATRLRHARARQAAA